MLHRLEARGHGSERSADITGQQSREPLEDMGMPTPRGQEVEPEKQMSDHSGYQVAEAHRKMVL